MVLTPPQKCCKKNPNVLDNGRKTGPGIPLNTAKITMAKSKSKMTLVSSNQNESRNSLVAKPMDRSPPNSPTIVNNTKYQIVVFLERGKFFNKCTLHPGEAVNMTRKQTGGGSLKFSYKVHAMIGDERSLPTKGDSIRNVLKVSAVPAAFAAGCLISAASAGTMTGPSAALAPLVRGIVVKGVTVSAADIAAGTLMAERTKKVAKILMENHEETVKCVTGKYKPKERYLSVEGGLLEGPIVVRDISRRKFKRLSITNTKAPMDPSEVYEKLSAASFDDSETDADSSRSMRSGSAANGGKENERGGTNIKSRPQMTDVKNVLVKSYKLKKVISESTTKQNNASTKAKGKNPMYAAIF